MASAAPKHSADFKRETPEAREARMTWERARLAEADADFAAGRYIEGDEAIRWLENEIAEAQAGFDRESD